MKSILMLVTLVSISLMSTGCSSTWDGVKNDTASAYDATKKSIHEATK